jgi:DNA-directed RNA polymerase subunit RPC12/RpoP
MLRRLRNAFRRKPALALQVRALEEMLVLTPQAFELAICNLLTEMGFRRVQRVGGAGDLGVDITAKDEHGRTTAVQCKRYAPDKRIGSREVQQFIGMTVTHHTAERMLYVTTSAFTTAASQLAHKHGIELIDGDKLTQLLIEHRGALPEREMPYGQPSFRELLELDAAGIIDLDRFEVTVDPGLLDEFGAVSEEELAAEQQLDRAEAHAAGLPFASPNFNPTAGDAPPIDCHRCGGTMTWDFGFGGYHCPSCGRRLAFDGQDFRVVNTGDADAGAGGKNFLSPRPEMPAPPAVPFTAPDGSQWMMVAPLEMQRVCENCGNQMEPVWSLPGYQCRSCGRSEMYIDAQPCK